MPLSFLSLIFPKICLSCKREGSHLCTDCLSTIPFNNSYATFPLPLSSLFVATTYENNLIRHAIYNFKYRPFLKGLAEPLSSFIISYLALLDKQPEFLINTRDVLLCPLPLHPRRLRWRGYNQAEELAKHLALHFRILLRPDVLLRMKNTKPQVELGEHEREKNMAGAFKVFHPEIISGKHVLLVDDVYTSGTTMHEAARCLKEAGAKRVSGIVIARG